MKAQGRKSKFGSDIHTPGHIETEYLHTKFHRRTTSKKKVQKWGLRPYRAKNDHAWNVFCIVAVLFSPHRAIVAVMYAL